MSVDLPSPIAAYMAASARLDADAILAPFAADAVVHDERHTHRGHDAIRAWIVEAALGNAAVPTPLAFVRDGDVHVVTAGVAGRFPGSPITLTFRFTLTGDQIASLEIG
jgi:ketosteroid isomerase-like protein